MKSTGKFTARPERGEIDCYLDIVGSPDEVRLTARIMLSGGPPYRYRETTLIMSISEAGDMAKSLIGALTHALNQAKRSAS